MGFIFIGKAGGELGIRGEIMAVHAADGTDIWQFNTIPGPGETGSDTWENAGSYEHGGGATWTSYNLDASAGLLLTSVVAAFNTADGTQLVAGAGKDGYVHVVNRATGELRFKAPIVSRYENGTTSIPTTAYLRFCPVAAAQWNGPAFNPDSGLLYMNGIDWCGSAIKGTHTDLPAGQVLSGLGDPIGLRHARPDPAGLRLDQRFRTRERAGDVELPAGDAAACRIDFDGR
jgi:alcohol dehydrogenase (cytochrome c)